MTLSATYYKRREEEMRETGRESIPELRFGLASGGSRRVLLE